MIAVTGEQLQAWLTAAVVAVFLAADLVIVVLWLMEAGTARPILAPRWSVADLILALQAVVGLLLLSAIPPMLLAMILAPRGQRALEMMPPPIKYGLVILPIAVLQQVALVTVPLLAAGWKYRLPDEETWEALGFRAGRGGWRRGLLLGLVTALVLIPASFALESGVEYALNHGWVPAGPALRQMAREADAGTYVREIGHSPLAVGLAVLLVGILAPIAEEVFFRGFAYRVLRGRFGVVAGILLSGVLFGAAHGNPLALLPISIMGIVLAVLRERTGSLIPSITVHCLNNCVATVMLLFSR